MVLCRGCTKPCSTNRVQSNNVLSGHALAVEYMNNNNMQSSVAHSIETNHLLWNEQRNIE